MADFTVGNIYFLLSISLKARPSFFRILHTVIRLSLDVQILLYRWNQIDLSLITSTVTLKTSFTWYNATTAISSTSLKTVSTNTADHLTIHLISKKPNTVSEHFLINDHSAKDITLILLELIKSNRDSVRKAREAYLIDRGKTFEPLGINKKDEM